LRSSSRRCTEDHSELQRAPRPRYVVVEKPQIAKNPNGSSGV
jgi:hypothetical protein